MIYVPPMFAADAIMEAADAGIKFIVCITEGVPVLDMTRVLSVREGEGRAAARPELPGLITPGQSKVGIIPGRICTPGNVGVVSRSGTLTYEVVYQLTRAGIGQSTCVGIGGDPINGTNFIDCLAAFEADPETKAVAMMGEIGGTDEQEAARVREGAHEEAGRRLHRRPDRAAGPPHGPRGRDHLRLVGHGGGEDRGVRGGGHGRREAADRLRRAAQSAHVSRREIT